MNGAGAIAALLLLFALLCAAYFARERAMDRRDDARAFNWDAIGPARQGQCNCAAPHASGVRIHPRRVRPVPFTPSPVLERASKILPPDFDPNVDSGVGGFEPVKS